MKNFVMVGLLFLAIILVGNTLFVVKQTERAVMLRFGELVNADIQPGLHVKIPWVNTVRIFDARLQTEDVLHRGLHLVGEGEDLLGVTVDRATCVGQLRPSADPDEERGAHGLLQLPNLDRDGRLADGELIGSPGEAAQAGDLVEDVQLVEVGSHNRPL